MPPIGFSPRKAALVLYSMLGEAKRGGKPAPLECRRSQFLGFSLTAGPEVKRVIAPKALDRSA
jgi:hypothetical protein